MKTSLHVGLAALALIACLSCNKAEEGDLTITMTGSTSYLIPADAQSCANIVSIAKSPSTAATKEITSLYFNYQGAELSWKSLTDTAYIVSMDFEFPGGLVTPDTCSISGDELTALFYKFDTKEDWDSSLAATTDVAIPTTRATGSFCRIRCGGFSVADKKRSLSIVGSVTVRGFQRSENGDEKPFKAKTSVKLLYQ